MISLHLIAKANTEGGFRLDAATTRTELINYASTALMCARFTLKATRIDGLLHT